MESGNDPNMSNTQKQDQLFRAFQRFMEQNAASGDAGLPVANAASCPVASGSANAGMQFDGTLVPPPTGAARSAPCTASGYVPSFAPPARPPHVLAQAANPAPPCLALPAIAAVGSAPGTAPRPPPPPAVHPRAPVHLVYANQNGRQQRSLTGRQSGSGNGRAMTLGFFGASGTNDVMRLFTDQEVHAGKTPSIRSRFAGRRCATCLVGRLRLYAARRHREECSNAEIRAAVIKAFPDLNTPRRFAFAKFAPQRAFLSHDVMHIDDVADFAALHVFYRGCKYCFIIDADFEENTLSPEQFAFEEEWVASMEAQKDEAREEMRLEEDLASMEQQASQSANNPLGTPEGSSASRISASGPCPKCFRPFKQLRRHFPICKGDIKPSGSSADFFMPSEERSVRLPKPVDNATNIRQRMREVEIDHLLRNLKKTMSVSSEAFHHFHDEFNAYKSRIAGRAIPEIDPDLLALSQALDDDASSMFDAAGMDDTAAGKQGREEFGSLFDFEGQSVLDDDAEEDEGTRIGKSTFAQDGGVDSGSPEEATIAGAHGQYINNDGNDDNGTAHVTAKRSAAENRPVIETTAERVKRARRNASGIQLEDALDSAEPGESS
ncbi:hypothetical protein QFC20_006156 [Naganishia adeliensis]|uniref:Uncharacterized protein n=1 Tax=Naganishia adeliensis TaxID=92952 RepID=A0ACC2VEP3_9TREE|nr:hypothetical protein QFC20_006156 [Naganishia adeliensis]